MSEFLPCPVCSGPPHYFERPMWWVAPRVSAHTGVPHAFLVGCNHVQEVLKPEGYQHLIEQPRQPGIVARWNERAWILFAERTARWTDAERLSWQIRLFGPLQTMQQPAKAKV